MFSFKGDFGDKAVDEVISKAADTAGFGALSEIHEKELVGAGLFVIVISRVVVENLVQIWLQVSYISIMLEFGGSDVMLPLGL